MQDNFEAVWSRVTGSEAQYQTDAEARQLLHYLQGAADGAAAYQQLLRQTRSRQAAMLLRRCYAGKLQQQRRLASSYFLLTGETCKIPKAAAVPSGTWSEQLRERYRRESEAVQACEAAAQQSSSALRELYRQLARQEKQHAFLLRRIIEGLF